MKKKQSVSEKRMPDLRGMDLNKAKLILNQYGIRINRVLFDEDKTMKNRVIRQSIPADEIIKNQASIDLTIAEVNPIRFLPSNYQNTDLNENSFLNRFLWVIQSMAHPVKDKLNNIHQYFNPVEAPGDFYKWLATWFDVDTSYAIPEEKMRLLIREAVVLYRFRGTRRGITKILEIISGIKPEIIEHSIPYSEYIIDGNQLVERPIIHEIFTRNYFTVHFPVPAVHFDLEMIRKINDVIRAEKPVNSFYFLTFEKGVTETGETGFAIGLDQITENPEV